MLVNDPVIASAQPIVNTPRPTNMGVKDSRAPVNFSPVDQVKMTNMFGQSYEGKYERSVGPLISAQPVQPPVSVATPVAQPYDLA